MAARRTLTWTLRSIAAVLVGLALFVGLADVHLAREARFALRAYLRSGPDYDRLARHRASQGGAAPAPGEAAPAPYWTDFRGPGRLGIYAEGPLRLDWDGSPPALLWRQPVGDGYASFVVARGLAYTLEQRREREALVAYELTTGREVWIQSWPGRFEEALSKPGPRATPVLAGLPAGLPARLPTGAPDDAAPGLDRVLAQGALGELLCARASDGVPLWRRNVLADAGAENLVYGTSASPLVLGGLVIAVSGAPVTAVVEGTLVPTPRPGGATGTLIAYDLATGEPRWSALYERMAYVSPFAAELGGRAQIVLATAARVLAVDPVNGDELWSYPWPIREGNSCSQPLVAGPDRILLSAGYGTGSALLAIEPDGGGLRAREVWRTPRFKSRFNSPVLLAGRAYGLDEGVLTCLEVATGERVWRGGRYGYGQLLLAGEHLVILTEDGDLALVSATPDGFDERARLPAISGMTMNVPALAHGLLLVRNAVEMACFDLRP